MPKHGIAIPVPRVFTVNIYMSIPAHFVCAYCNIHGHPGIGMWCPFRYPVMVSWVHVCVHENFFVI